MFEPGSGPAKGRGRPKGSPNKVGRSAREVIATVAEGLGGTERMIAWAQEDEKNERAFWTNIYPKLVPLQVTGANGGALQSEMTVRFVGANAKP